MRGGLKAAPQTGIISVMKLEDNTNYIVSGLERSGTSLVMQILDAGGVPCAFDTSSRPLDDNNPRGYFELEGGKIISRLREDVIMLLLDHALLPKATKLSGRVAGPETSSPDTAFAQIRISQDGEIGKGTQCDLNVAATRRTLRVCRFDRRS